MFGGCGPVVEVGLSKGVDGDAGAQRFLVVEALNGLLHSLHFGRVKRYIFFVGEFCVLKYDLLTIKVIEIQYKVADFLFIFLNIEIHLIGKFRGELADLAEKGIRSFGLMVVYAALFIKLQVFLHFLFFFCWNVAIYDIAPFQILQKLLLFVWLQIEDAFLRCLAILTSIT